MKILLHVHTTYSADGQISCQQLAATAKKLQFGAVFITDHFEDLTPQQYDSLISECALIKNCMLLPGYERSWEGYHLLALNQRELNTQSDLATWSQAVRNCGGMVILAHPSRYGFNVPERILEHCDGIEIWNSKRYYDGTMGPNPRAMRLIAARRLAVCGQDAHLVAAINNVGIVIDDNVKTPAEIVGYLKNRSYSLQNAFIKYGPDCTRGRRILWILHFFRTPFIKAAVAINRKIKKISACFKS